MLFHRCFVQIVNVYEGYNGEKMSYLMLNETINLLANEWNSPLLRMQNIHKLFHDNIQFILSLF